MKVGDLVMLRVDIIGRDTRTKGGLSSTLTRITTRLFCGQSGRFQNPTFVLTSWSFRHPENYLFPSEEIKNGQRFYG